MQAKPMQTTGKPEWRRSFNHYPGTERGRKLGCPLASVAALQFPREQLEIIVVDHESKDRTAEIALHGRCSAYFQRRAARYRARAISVPPRQRGKSLRFWTPIAQSPRTGLIGLCHTLRKRSVGIVGSYYTIRCGPVELAPRRSAEADRSTAQDIGREMGSGREHAGSERKCFGSLTDSMSRLRRARMLTYARESRKNIGLSKIPTIRCLHHGEPKTLWQLFRKELWRGRDNFLGVLRHGLQWREIPSLVLPIYSVVSLAAFLMSLIIAALRFSDTLPTILLTAILFLLPLLAVASLTSLRSGHSRYILHFTVLYAVYFLARGIAPFYRWRYV